MTDKVLKSLTDVIISMCQIFYIRRFRLEDKKLICPNVDNLVPDIFRYLEGVNYHLLESIEETPLYNAYKAQLEAEELLTVVNSIFNHECISGYTVSDKIKPSNIFGSDDLIQYEYDQTISKIFNIDDMMETVMYTGYQFMSDYLYHNKHIRVNIESVTSQNHKYYLTSDPTNVLLVQNQLQHSQVAFNIWLYKNCPNVMDVIDFVTTAKLVDKRTIEFSPYCGNVFHDIHYGMYIK